MKRLWKAIRLHHRRHIWAVFSFPMSGGLGIFGGCLTQFQSSYLVSGATFGARRATLFNSVDSFWALRCVPNIELSGTFGSVAKFWDLRGTNTTARVPNIGLNALHCNGTFRSVTKFWPIGYTMTASPNIGLSSLQCHRTFRSVTKCWALGGTSTASVLYIELIALVCNRTFANFCNTTTSSHWPLFLL